MRKFYLEPELEIRKFAIIQGKVLTTSTPETGGNNKDNTLNDDDEFNIFGN